MSNWDTDVPCTRCSQSGYLGNYGTGFIQCPTCGGSAYVAGPDQQKPLDPLMTERGDGSWMKGARHEQN